MRILVTGANGKLGARLARDLAAGAELQALGKRELDIRSLREVRAACAAVRPDILVNAAAYTQVDRCEDDVDTAFGCNAVAVRNLTIGAGEVGARLIHFSTDFVFDGARSGPPYIEYDLPKPRSVYGRSKLAGESEALGYSRAAVLRLAWVYGAGGWNFTDWIVEELSNERPVRILTDQVGTPTWVGDVSRQTAILIESGGEGLYHSSGEGACSRYEWAIQVAKLAGLDPDLILPIRSKEFPQKAPRPGYSVLENFCLKSQDLNAMRPWEEALQDHLDERA